jgi:hypothetical protein
VPQELRLQPVQSASELLRQERLLPALPEQEALPEK